MRRLIKWVIVLAVLWSGWWAVASFGAQRGLSGWIDANRSIGLQGEVSQGGFPFQIRSQLQDVVLRNPESAVAVRADSLVVSAPTYWPGDVTAELPQTPISIETAAGIIVLKFSDANAGLRLTPGPRWLR